MREFDRERHMILRLLQSALALVIWLGLPLCCCQSAYLLGRIVGTRVPCAEAVLIGDRGDAASSCCGGCCGDKVADADEEATTTPGSPAERNAPSPCDDCPACLGVAGLIRATEPARGFDAGVSLAGSLADLALPVVESWRTDPLWRVPVHPRSAQERDDGGRVILRRRCALIL